LGIGFEPESPVVLQDGVPGIFTEEAELVKGGVLVQTEEDGAEFEVAPEVVGLFLDLREGERVFLRSLRKDGGESEKKQG
jgi:hypothetical protein